MKRLLFATSIVLLFSVTSPAQSGDMPTCRATEINNDTTTYRCSDGLIFAVWPGMWAGGPSVVQSGGTTTVVKGGRTYLVETGVPEIQSSRIPCRGLLLKTQRTFQCWDGTAITVNNDGSQKY